MAITLKAARINAGILQKDAAKALGLTKQTLSSYEAYKTVPTIKMAQEIATLYGTSVDNIKFF